MFFLLIYVICEIQTGCVPKVQTHFSTEKACVEEKKSWERNDQILGIKHGYACVEVKGFEK